MSDRAKLTLASLGYLMLPYEVGYTTGFLVLTAIGCTVVDATKQMLGWNGKVLRY